MSSPYKKCLSNYKKIWNFEPVADNMCRLFRAGKCLSATGYPKKTKKCEQMVQDIVSLISYTEEA